MHPARLLSFTFPALLLTIPAGCADAPGAAPIPPDAKLEAIFPSHAQSLLAAPLSADAAITPGVERSAVAVIRGPRLDPRRTGRATDDPIEAVLPREGDGVLRFRLPGFEVRVTEEGLAGEGRIRGGAVVYPRAGGASLFRQGPAGCEEWLLLENGTPDEDRPVAVWHVEGARLVQRGEEVVLRDHEGADRIEVRAPLAFTNKGRPLRIRLEARGQDVALFAPETAEPVLIDPEWLPAAPMNTSRYAHDAVRLNDGRVLVTGQSATADVYNETTDKWTATGPLVNTHFHGTATLLADGRVLVTGGINPNTLAEAEIYDPATNQWTATGSMTTVRWFHRATLLPNGKVLVSGGQTGVAAVYLTSAELYDPATGKWSATASMAAERSEHFATLLPNGKVIVGAGKNAPKQTELYDPATGMWSAGAPMVTDHFGSPAPALLPDGTLLVACANVVSGAVGRYDPVADLWSMAGAIAKPRIYCTATALLNGSALVAGGYYNTYFADADRYDPVAKSWTVTKPMTQARSQHTATLLPSGGVLVAGGFDGVNFLLNSEIYATGAAAGDPCAVNGDCTSGFCATGVCCDSACQGPCKACTVAGGAPKDGTCVPVAGTCMPLDECHEAGTCDLQKGTCSNPAKADGSQCAGGTCQGGTCMAGAASSSVAASGSGAGGAGGGSGSGGADESQGGCGCEVGGARGAGAVWVGLGFIIAAWRRRAGRRAA